MFVDLKCSFHIKETNHLCCKHFWSSLTFIVYDTLLLNILNIQMYLFIGIFSAFYDELRKFGLIQHYSYFYFCWFSLDFVTSG